MPSIFDKIQAKLEVLRLEKRYTRQRHRRSTFVSNAVYVDGEYVYQTPYNTGSSTDSSSSGVSSPRVDALHGEKNITRSTTTTAPVAFGDSSMGDFDASSQLRERSDPPSMVERKRLHRFSSVPRFGVPKDLFGGKDFFSSEKSSLARVEERRLSMLR